MERENELEQQQQKKSESKMENKRCSQAVLSPLSNSLI